MKQSFLLQQQWFLQCGKARSMREAAAERRERPPDPSPPPPPSPSGSGPTQVCLIAPLSSGDKVEEKRDRRQEADEGKKFGGGES